MAAVNGSATATEDARYPSHLTSEWFSARRSSRSARRGSKKSRARLLEETAGASDSSSSAAALAAADSASAAGSPNSAAGGRAGPPAGPLLSSVAGQQYNPLMTASMESDDGGLPLFSDSAAQRLEPAELPNPKYVSSLVQQIETRLTAPLATSASALLGSRHLERKNTPPSERGSQTGRSADLVPSTPEQGLEASAKQPVERIKVPQLASMLSWGSRSGADESPPNLTRFVTQSASAFDTAEMARHAKGSAALAADDAGGELMPAGRRGSTRSRSSLDARSEHGELIAAAKAAAAEWKQQAEQRAEAARAWVDAAAGIRISKGSSTGPSSRSLSPMNSIGSPHASGGGPKRGVAAFAAQQSLEDKRRRQQRNGDVNGDVPEPPSPFEAAREQMAGNSVEALMESRWSGSGSLVGPLAADGGALQSGAEWRSPDRDAAGGVSPDDVSLPTTVASSGRVDSSVVPELVAAYDQAVSEHSEPLPPTFAARHRLATLAASFQGSSSRGGTMGAAAQRAVDATGEEEADGADAPAEVADALAAEPSPNHRIDTEPTANAADTVPAAMPVVAPAGILTRPQTAETGWRSDESEGSGGDAISPRVAFAIPSLGDLALQQSAARVEEAYEALLEGRPIRSWSAPELVELEAIANGEQYVPPWDWGTETEEEEEEEQQRGPAGAMSGGEVRSAGGTDLRGDGADGEERATDEEEPAGYLSDLGPRRSPWRRESGSSNGDEPAWARLPLTPELRAAKAAREQALQRAPLIRRSQAALYQMAANLRDGGRHRRKTLRELFAQQTGGLAPAATFPLDQIIRAGSESAALEARYQALMAKIKRTSSFERGDDITEDEDETDEDGARNGIEDETARQMAAAGALIHAAAIHATVRGEDDDGDADIEDASGHGDLATSSDDDEFERASPISTSDEEGDEDEAEDATGEDKAVPGRVPSVLHEEPGTPSRAAAAAATLFVGTAAAGGMVAAAKMTAPSGSGEAAWSGSSRRQPGTPQPLALDPATPSPVAPRPSQRHRRLTAERPAASMSDDGTRSPAIVRWRSGKLLDRLNDEAEAHTDRMSVLDGTDEGEAAVSADAAAGGRISFIEHPRQMSLTDVGLTDLPFGPASSAATAAGEPLTRPAPELAYDHPQGPLSVWESQLGFTDAQLKVLESQILAYRRLRRLRKAAKSGDVDWRLSPEELRGIKPQPLEPQEAAGLEGREGSGDAGLMDPALREALQGRARAEAALAEAMVDEDEAEAGLGQPMHNVRSELPPDLPSDPPSDPPSELPSEGLSDSVPSEFHDSDAGDPLANGHHVIEETLASGPGNVVPNGRHADVPPPVEAAERHGRRQRPAFRMARVDPRLLMDPPPPDSDMDPELDHGLEPDPEPDSEPGAEDGEGGLEAVQRHLQLLDQLGLSPGLHGRTSVDINELRRASVDGRSSSSGFDAASGVPGVASYGTAGLDLRSRSFDGGRPSAVPRLQLPPILDDASPGLSKRSSLAHDQAPLVPVRVPAVEAVTEALQPGRLSEIQPAPLVNAPAPPPSATVDAVPASPTPQRRKSFSSLRRLRNPNPNPSGTESPQQQEQTQQSKQGGAAPSTPKKPGLFRRVFSKKDSQKDDQKEDLSVGKTPR